MPIPGMNYKFFVTFSILVARIYPAMVADRSALFGDPMFLIPFPP